MTRRQIIRWLRRHNLTGILIAAALAIIIGAAVILALAFTQPRVMVRLGDGIFNARVATTAPQLEKGLSGTKQLAPGQAMLFVFGGDEKWSIWMKDMNYPIDIVWLDANKTVVYMAKNVSPDTYPQSFQPNKPARYVVELAAGTIDQRAIAPNMVASFELEKEGK